MKTIGYIRVSTDKQDLEKQKYLLWEYAQKQDLQIGEFIEVEISSRKNTKERRIDELLDKLQAGDMLLVTELSWLGRNMLETMNFIHDFLRKHLEIRTINIWFETQFVKIDCKGISILHQIGGSVR